MSNKKASEHRNIDQRIRRTHERLGSAIVQLIQEKPIDEITVQEVLDRASVGRSTFYLHFKDKDDLLLAQLEQFLERMSMLLVERREISTRVVAVTEMFAHVGGPKNRIYRALSQSGRLHDFFDLAQGYFQRGIRMRLIQAGHYPKMSKRELEAYSSALAGSLLALFRWWLERGGQEPPEKMDELFHRIASMPSIRA
jgi:AcrR family transcriptional regulator